MSGRSMGHSRRTNVSGLAVPDRRQSPGPNGPAPTETEPAPAEEGVWEPSPDASVGVVCTIAVFLAQVP